MSKKYDKASPLETFIGVILGLVFVFVYISVRSCGGSDNSDYKYGKPQGYAGTYRFDDEENHHTVIIVKEDGRCILKSAGGDFEFLGTAVPLSSHTFMIKPTGKLTFVLPTITYINGESRYRTGVSNWYTHNVVFDVSEGRLYRNKAEYNNRDVAGAEYTKMTYSSSTELPISICKTCGEQYYPDDGVFFSYEYCTKDHPQTCKYCHKRFTINTDRNACFGICGRCYEKKSSVRIYESVTGRKVY